MGKILGVMAILHPILYYIVLSYCSIQMVYCSLVGERALGASVKMGEFSIVVKQEFLALKMIAIQVVGFHC